MHPSYVFLFAVSIQARFIFDENEQNAVLHRERKDAELELVPPFHNVIKIYLIWVAKEMQ